MRRGTGRSPSAVRARAPVVLVFGESENDRRAIGHLVRGLRPDLAGNVEERRRPLVLIKNATLAKARSNAQEIAALVRVETKAREVLAVLAHEDCDAVEPAHACAAARIEKELLTAGCPAAAIGVTPAWEIEAWWMLFPEAAGKIVKGWRDPDDWLGKSVGAVQNAKEKFASALQPRPRRPSPPRSYEERDSIAIAKNVVDDGLIGSFQNGQRATPGPGSAPTQTRSDSFERFRVKVLAIEPAANP